ncbi:MAG: hypothetical protein WCF85_02645 [Rhodospirillaceae bacterium]
MPAAQTGAADSKRTKKTAKATAEQAERKEKVKSDMPIFYPGYANFLSGLRQQNALTAQTSKYQVLPAIFFCPRPGSLSTVAVMLP